MRAAQDGVSRSRLVARVRVWWSEPGWGAWEIAGRRTGTVRNRRAGGMSNLNEQALGYDARRAQNVEYGRQSHDRLQSQQRR